MECLEVADSSTVRVGFVGVGGRAGAHIEALQAIPGVEIVSVSDVDGERARAVAAEHSAAAYENTEEMLDAETLDALWVCTPPFAHRDARTTKRVFEEDVCLPHKWVRAG